jgi:hypothetical protein
MERGTRVGWPGVLLGTVMLLGVVAALTLFSPDPLSHSARLGIERGLDRHLDAMRRRAARSELTRLDRAELHLGIIAGIGLGYLLWPEAAAILGHAVYGDGSTLTLDASYFRQSPFVQRQIARLGPGDHSPIWFPQREDWRLSLAPMPIYLHVSTDTVRIGHPHVMFAAADSVPVWTRVPIGRLRLKIYDNLVGALQRHPFATHSAWKRAGS